MMNNLMPQSGSPTDAPPDDNSLAPQPGGGPTPDGPPPPATPETLMAKYQKLMQAGQTLSTVRQGLDQLTSLADTVTQEDVIKVAGTLVAKGLQPLAVASLLADMPEGSEQLAAWVSKHDQETTQRETQLDQVTNGIRHQLGVATTRSLMMDHVKEKLGA